jgi:sulfite exporter TauE/SafE
MEYFQALLIGVIGSFHCAGMCGPLALALPLNQKSWETRFLSAGIYNAGRLFTYALMGALFGFLGFGLAFWGLQSWVSIGMGIAMISGVVFPFLFRGFNMEATVGKGFAKIKGHLSRLFASRTYTAVFFIGLLNGLLPCGLVYIALAGAVVSTGPTAGALWMLAFGLGTIPVMLSIPLLGNIVTISFRKAVRKIIPFVIIAIGVLFILRGLNLGIPYVSPKIEQSQTSPKCCE